MATLKNTTLSDTGFIRLPVGTTGQRPSPAAGQFRYNTTTGAVEVYTAGTNIWQTAAARGVRAAGGTVYDVDVEGTTYRVHVFTSTGNSTFTVTRPGTVEYLVVGGGGAGGRGFFHGSGGGAGGFRTGIMTIPSGSYGVTVGTGGSGAVPANGGSSEFHTIISAGGGAGTGASGGSGGGNSYGGANAGSGNTPPTSPPQGNDGGRGAVSAPFDPHYGSGGGGGAGSIGGQGTSTTGGNGGAGLSSSISGITVTYAGGGGGSTFNGGTPGTGAAGGGNGSSGQATSATPNSGSGGGGSERSNGNTPGGNGGSGIVIIRYPLQSEPDVVQPKASGDDVVLDLDFAKPTVYAGSGTVVTDSRLNGVSGTVTGSSFINQRTNRSGFTFNGTSDEIILPRVNFGTNQFTVISWINLTTAVNSPNTTIPIHVYNTDTNGGGFRIFHTATSLGCWVRAGSNFPSVDASSPIPFGQIVQLAVTLTGNNMAFYLNGISNGGGSITGTVNNFNNVTAYLGVYFSGGFRFNGIAFDCKLYNRGLTAQEVQNNFNATRWRFGV
jgi:hypothetical protein